MATEYRFVHYALFVTYFPHLIAGPVLHHKEMMPQFDRRGTTVPTVRNFAVGLTIFVIGLFKKVLIADSLARRSPTASSTAARRPLSLFDRLGRRAGLHASSSTSISPATRTWRSDCRGLFGVRLPLNFDSPYKARNIIEFWRRWHMTLSRFLRDYLYIPLGGNRQGTVRTVRQPDGHHAARRAVARRRLDLRHLGRPARRLSRHQSRLASLRPTWHDVPSRALAYRHGGSR